MRLKEEKIFHIANLIANQIKAQDLVEFIDETAVRKELKGAILDCLKVDDEVDAKVRAKIGSYSRKIVEGSGEWEVLYRKFFVEEMARIRGRK